MPVRRLVIADAHVGQRPHDAEEMGVLVRAAVEAGYGELVYLGDAFQYLIGMSKFWTRTVRAVLGSWADARRLGVRVVLVEGNRDFFLDAPELAPFCDLAVTRYEVSAGPRRVLMVHGDRINREDRRYLFWAAVSKSRIARLWARLLPRRVAVHIVESMEARLADTNRSFRYRKPVEALEERARKAWARGIDLVLWGHFHTGWELGEGEKRAMVVPAWLETGAALCIDDDGTWTFVDQRLTPLAGVPTMRE